MNLYRNLIRTLFIALVTSAPMSMTHAATMPVTGWIVHNGTSTVGGTASNPTFTAGDNITVMAPFSDVTLANDGDFVEATTTLTLNNRSGTVTANTLNTQLRFALLDDSVNGTLSAGDFPNVGFTIEYGNGAGGNNPQAREQESLTQTAPFVSPTSINNGTLGCERPFNSRGQSGPVTFSIKLTRNAGALDMVGSISGIDTGDSNAPYLSTFGWTGHASTNFPLNGAFTFNRLAVFMGPNANAESASLSDSSVTIKCS